MNTGFSLPFIFSAFGEKGVATVAIFDFGNALLVLTFGYYIAMKYGKAENTKINYQKLFFLPPIWGLIFGLLFNLIKIPVPTIANNFLNQIGMLTIPLIMLSIGIYFSPRIRNLSRLLLVLFLRTGIGLILGFVLATVFNLQGTVRTIVTICCGAPVGYNTLVFASLEEMDKEFAASLVSISLLLGIIYVPLLIYFLWFQIDVEKKPLSKPKAYKSPLSKGSVIIEKKSFPLYLSSNPRIRLWILSVQLHYSQVVSVLSQYIFSELPLIASQVKTTVKRAMRINCIEMKSLFLWFVSFGDTKEMNIEYIPLLAIFFYAISF